MKILDTSPEVVALGEGLVEFAALERGRLEQVTTFRRGCGGDTSNFVVAAARLGASAGYITRVGDDDFGRACLALWQTEGVDISQVIVAPDSFTGTYFIAFDEAGQHTFTYYRAGSAASQLQPADVDPDYVGRARVFHTSGITQAISESARAAADAAIEAARARGVAISYDANVRPKLKAMDALRSNVAAVFARADIVFLSREDAAHMFGPTSVEDVVARVLDVGPQVVVLKRGPQGCLVGHRGDSLLVVPGWEVDSVDATGAGDAFDAAFVVEWLRGRSLEQAALFANAVGALTVRGLGAVTPIPARKTVEEFMIGKRLQLEERGAR